MNAVLLRSHGDEGFEYIGMISDFKHPDERHAERKSRVRHLYVKADTNVSASNRLFALAGSAMASGNVSLADRLYERATRRWRLHVRRMQQMRTFAENLSRELFERGV